MARSSLGLRDSNQSHPEAGLWLVIVFSTQDGESSYPLNLVASTASPAEQMVRPGGSNESKTKTRARRPRLLVIGGGMAGFGLCDRLARSGAIDSFDISLFGDEPQPAYDRVNLSSYFQGRSEADLLLADRDWYQRNKINLHTGLRIERLDPESQVAIDANGHAHAYDKAVIATGSFPFVPPIEGKDLPGVFVYRTLNDLNDIREHVTQKKCSRGAVLGGGLLGLEAAKVMMDLGLKASVIEMAPGLMPKQLDAKAASFLKDRIGELDVDVQLVRRSQRIEQCKNGGLRLHFENAEPLDVDILIIAAGVRPNDSLARKSGLEVGPRGGIVVDSKLQTSHSSIHAIGECVSFRSHVYGLVAPCFRMADVLSDHLAGDENASFEGADESAELKLLGVQVAAIGRSIGESVAGVVLTHRDESGYRKILLEQGCLVGAACVGPWDDLPQIRQAINRQQRLWPMHRRRFVRTGSLWSPGGGLPIAQWPADAVVCSCLSITKGTIQALIQSGVDQPDDIASNCGASTACGSCRSLVCALASGEESPPVGRLLTPLFAASVAALVVMVAWIFAPPVTMADSVQSAWRNVDILWRSDLARQISGFTLVGITVISMTFSLRKRTGWKRMGSYTFWRAVHGILGTLTLIGMMVHTGLKLGANLNLVLGICFLAAGLFGGAVGVVSSLESRATGDWAMAARRWRPRLAKLHLWVTWPLPALVAAHIVSFYWFTD
ncbi:MAG: FAD-dependent oxidoreductase [Planctomycetota bacterium]